MTSPTAPFAWFFSNVSHIRASRMCWRPASIVSVRFAPFTGGLISRMESPICRPATSWSTVIRPLIAGQRPIAGLLDARLADAFDV